GIVAGVDNSIGGIGIAPGVQLGFAMRYGTNLTDDHLGDAVMQCIAKLKFGDILLIDDQHFIEETDGSLIPMPIEVHPVMATHLTTIRALGITLVEPAGYWKSLIDPHCPPNSGGIIVGGINPDTGKREDVEHLSNF